MHADVSIYDRADAATSAYHQAIAAHSAAYTQLSLLGAAMWLSIAAACLEELADCAAAIQADVETRPRMPGLLTGNADIHPKEW